MILKSLAGFYTSPKHRPSPHRLEGITTRQHSGFYIASLPREYPLNAPQRKVRTVAKECGIHKGMGRRELVTAMIDCVGPKMRK
jgi:hypothetical protein